MKKEDKTFSSILVVDDNKDNLKVVSKFLKKEGYQIALAINVEDALNILEDTPIDLVLLDVMMPGTDGFSFCRQIKKEKRFADLPVIFLTAKTDTSDLVEGFEAGGVDYITKPFQKKELIARVNNHIELTLAKKRIQEQAEEIKKINRTKDHLYSIIAHDIKSPFSNISMLISALAEGYLEVGSEEYEEILQSINQSTQETYSLLENLLQWTRSQTGDLEVNPETFNMKEVTGTAVRFSELNARNKQIDLQVEMKDNLPLHADRNMMQSVMQNLVGNAIKFTPEGGKVTIQGIQENDQVIVKIGDTGVGISEENMKKLFTDRGQITTLGTNNEKGSGLGLLLAQSFVEQNGGKIKVESTPGEGTTLTLTFPKAEL